MPPLVSNHFRRDPYQQLRTLQKEGAIMPVVADHQMMEATHEVAFVSSEGLVAEADGFKWIVAGDIMVPTASNPLVWRRAMTVADVTGAARLGMSSRTMEMTSFAANEPQMGALYLQVRFYDGNIRSIANPAVIGLEPGAVDALWAQGIKAYSRGI